MEASKRMFETVTMYTITALLTLFTPGTVQLHCLCWGHRPLGPAAGIPRAEYLCSHIVEWWEENRDCREVQLLPLYKVRQDTLHKEAARAPSLSFCPITPLTLAKGQQANFMTAASCFKGSATVAVRKYVLTA